MAFADKQWMMAGRKARAMGWTAEDVANLGQATPQQWAEIRTLVRSVPSIITAIERGATSEFLTDRQEAGGWDTGRVVLATITEQGFLEGCLDELELKAIQAKGLEFYRRHFAGKYLPGWRGVQGDSVPVLYEGGDGVILLWRRVGFSFRAHYPALRRKPASQAGK